MSNEKEQVALPLETPGDPTKPASVQITQNRINLVMENIKALAQQRDAKRQEVQKSQSDLQNLEFSISANNYLKQQLEELRKELEQLG